MSNDASYPKEAAVGGGESIESNAQAAETERKAEPATGPNRKIITGAAIGIGSAALVAALLYANRSRKSGRDPS